MFQRLSCALLVSFVASVPAGAEAPAIQHEPVACVVAGRFPRLEARFAPAESVARARVQFQAEGGRHWYGVAMKPGGTAFSAVLPKPKKSLKSYRYYLEVVDTALGTSRTPEYSTTVAASGAACADVKEAGSVSSAVVKVEVPAGAPSLPGGFSASGVTAVGAAGAAVAAGAATAAAAGGGVPAALLIGGGVVLAGAGVAVAAGAAGGKSEVVNDDGVAASTTYRGSYNGQFAQISHHSGTGNTCAATYALAGTATLTLDQTSGAATGSFSTNGTDTFVSNTCLSPSANSGVSPSWGAPLTGTTGALSARLQQGPTTVNGVAVTTSSSVYEFSGALNGGVIVGTITLTLSGTGVPQAGAGFPFTFEGSTTIPVTLR
jgi:hypothetical protein